MLTADGVNRLKKESSILKIPFDLHLVLVHVIWATYNNMGKFK